MFIYPSSSLLSTERSLVMVFCQNPNPTLFRNCAVLEKMTVLTKLLTVFLKENCAVELLKIHLLQVISPLKNKYKPISIGKRF